ncbi:MAG: cytochrome c biosis protein CcmG, thiol:disulfide interchange protein DsbE [Actinomycetota bacterium]|nr:cytochrome c biosis protein CcmG, thiol:disulfide interchange protein DsbE [Actinomycetota bacterium]
MIRSQFRIRWIALGIAVVLVAFTVVLAVQTRSQPSVPRLVLEHASAPQLNLKTLDGKAVTSAQLRSKTYVVNFFNSWCIPCQQETPALKTFYDQHKSEGDFAMLGIIIDDDAPTMRGYVRDRGIAWPVLVDPKGSAALDYGTTGQPETYVVAPDGVVVCGTLGPSSVAELNTWLAAARAGQQCT